MKMIAAIMVNLCIDPTSLISIAFGSYSVYHGGQIGYSPKFVRDCQEKIDILKIQNLAISFDFSNLS